MNILHVDSSITGEQSVSRLLSAAVVARLRTLDPQATVTYRDVVADPLPEFSGAIASARSQPAAARADASDDDVAKLDRVVAEVLAADVLVVGAPMYNFGLPSQLKHWLDALAAPGTTFRYGENGAEGLLGGRRLVVASARGGFYGPGTPHAAFDHQETHLVRFFEFLGIDDIEIVRAEGVKKGPDVRERAIEGALADAAALAAA